jgi:hypothetical protein
MKKGIVVALAVTGSLALGPSALAATAEPAGLLPGTYTPQDHGKGWDGKKHDKGHGHHHHGHGGHHHGHHGHHHGDGAHASDYHSHREHPRHDHGHHHHH